MAARVDYSLATHDQDEIDRILKYAADVYYQAIINGRFDVDGYEKKMAAQERAAKENAS